MMARWTTRLAIAAVATWLVAARGGDAVAQPSGTADLTVYEIRASNEAGASDPEVTQGELGKKLKKGPFRAWSRFQKLAKHTNQIVQLKALAVDVATGKLSVLYRGRQQTKGKKDRLRMSLTMDDRQGKRTLDTTIELDTGDYFLVGGQPLGDGATFILAISVR